MIEIVLKKDIEFKEAIAVEGFPGVGLVGHIAATYLVSALKVPEIGYIRTDMLPPISMILNGKVIPPVRIYGKEDIVVFVSDLAFPEEKTFYMAEKLGEFMEHNDIVKSISLAGIGTGASTENVFGVGSNKDVIKQLKELGIDILPMGSISGGSGALLLECLRKDIPSLALLAETFGNRPDPRAASEMLKRISKLIDKKIDVKPLIEEAKRIEANLKALSRDVEKQTKKEKFDTMYM
ncbi:MAG: proteasome assembly chaperone family protein [Candidatus Methanofastidiosia archaeon]